MANWVDGMTKAHQFVDGLVVNVTEEDQELARRFLIKSGAEDLLGMLDL
jgi:hypothetical protein